jgi:hypothetical protein
VRFVLQFCLFRFVSFRFLLLFLSSIPYLVYIVGKQVDKQKIESEYDNFMAELGLTDTSSRPNSGTFCYLLLLFIFSFSDLSYLLTP